MIGLSGVSRLLSTADVAKKLNITITRVQQMRGENKGLPFIKISGVYGYFERDVENFAKTYVKREWGQK